MADGAEAKYLSPTKAWWMVAVLLLLHLLSYLDRQIINLMIDDIKHGLGISEFQVSLLQGFSFVVCFSLLSVPFGWASDRLPRRSVIFVGLIIWSLATCACGLARNFLQLLSARFALGFGEAALAPAAYSLLPDAFRRDRLALAMSVFSTGSAFGTAISLGLGGFLIDAIPAVGASLPLVGALERWQIIFILAGLPCLLLSWLIFTVREPGRHNRPEATSTFSEVFVFLKAHKRFFSCHFVAFGVLAMCNYGLAMWLPAHLHRNFGWEASSIGLALCIFTGVGGTSGSVIMGVLADRWFRAGVRDVHLRIFFTVGFVQTALVAVAMTSGNVWVCLVLSGLAFSVSLSNGIGVTILQLMTPNHLHGRLTSIYLVVYNTIALGLGPSMVAAITQFGFGDNKMVGASIAVTFAIGTPICGLLFWLAMRPMRERLAIGAS